ncbi:MAG: hypothetical protein ABI995_11295, partial [Acidobacteriota bacterium]
MRCLYCGKELALLKRLTGGAEFCSDAHRKQYQAEYNDLALSRLLQNQPARGNAPALPIANEEPTPAPRSIPVRATPPPPARASTPPPVRVTPASPDAAKLSRSAEAAPPQRVAPPQPAKPIESAAAPADLAGPVPDLPSLIDLEQTIANAGDPPFAPRPVTTLPRRNYSSASEVWNPPIWIAPQVEWKPFIVPINGVVRPREKNLEVRDFTRQAISPAATLQHNSANDQVALASAIGDSMEITNQPHPPQGTPAIWWAGPVETGSFPLLLGDLARLDFADTGFEGDTAPQPARTGGAGPVPLPAPAPRETPRPLQAAPQSIEISEAASRAVQRPESSTAVEPQVQTFRVQTLDTQSMEPPAAAVLTPIAGPATQPLPIELNGAGTHPGSPKAILSEGVAVQLEPQAPRTSALPLRPVMVLGPAPIVAIAPAAEPDIRPSTNEPTSGSSNSDDGPRLPSRPNRAGNGKARRTDVRVIPASSPAVAQVPPAAIASNRPAPPLVQPKPVPAQPPIGARAIATPVPVEPRPVEPRNVAPRTPAAAPVEAVEKRRPAPAPAPPAEIDLGLPTLHLVQEGRWTRLSGPVKIAVAGVLALCLGGAAYVTLYTNPAAAKPVAQGQTYVAGKQLSTSGWIEDWAPAGSSKR